MIALLGTYLVVAYVFAPGVLFRIVAGLSVPLRAFQFTKTVEVTFGVLVAVLPFLFAFIVVWHAPIARSYPYPCHVGSIDQYQSDREFVLTLMVSPDPAKLLQSDHGQENQNWQMLERVWHRQARFLFWYYLFSGVEGASFAYLVRKYGDWQDHAVYAWIARNFLLPNISRWQFVLTAFAFPEKPKRDIFADVLCDDHLYRGRISGTFSDLSGDLSALFLKDVSRFRRKDYESAVEKAENGKVDSEAFWREVPGSNFYIPAGKISNVNVRFPLEESELTNYIMGLLEGDGLKTRITATYLDPKSTEQPGESTPGGG